MGERVRMTCSKGPQAGIDFLFLFVFNGYIDWFIIYLIHFVHLQKNAPPEQSVHKTNKKAKTDVNHPVQTSQPPLQYESMTDRQLLLPASSRPEFFSLKMYYIHTSVWKAWLIMSIHQIIVCFIELWFAMTCFNIFNLINSSAGRAVSNSQTRVNIGWLTFKIREHLL